MAVVVSVYEKRFSVAEVRDLLHKIDQVERLPVHSDHHVLRKVVLHDDC